MVPRTLEIATIKIAHAKGARRRPLLGVWPTEGIHRDLALEEHFCESVVPRFLHSLLDFSERDSVCAPACGDAAMYFRRKTSAGRAYLQIVESRRDGD
ncbi:MAG: hypothetical protein WB500_16595 [Rhodoplanes sp.]